MLIINGLLLLLKLFTKYSQVLSEETSSASLGLFRILVGIILFCQTAWLISSDFIQEHIFDSSVQFKFYYFDFLEALPPDGMKWMMLLMLLATLCIIFGRFFKIAVIFFGLSFTYFWLLDKSYFNNHYYFISLMVLILAFTNADGWGSLKGKNKRASVPYWQLFLLKSQLLIVFLIGGINKINYDWLFKFQPMKHILEAKAELNGYDWLLNNGFYVFFSWGGMLFDLLIGFALWFPKTRKIGVIVFLSFNLINYWLFHDIGEIGFFPFLLMACMVIYFNSEKIASKLKWLVPIKKEAKEAKIQIGKTSKFVIYAVSIYLLIQILLPFRHVLYDDYVDWTGQGQRFSWRMKIMYKEVDMHWYLVQEGDSIKNEVNVGSFLSDKQYTNLMYYPDFIPSVAKYIKAEGDRRGLKNSKVVATFTSDLNGRGTQALLDSTLDLSTINFIPSQKNLWIKKLKN